MLANPELPQRAVGEGDRQHRQPQQEILRHTRSRCPSAGPVRWGRVGRYREEVDEHSRPHQQTSQAEEHEEGGGMRPQQGHCFDGQSEGHQEPRNPQPADQRGRGGGGHGIFSFHILTPARPCTSWILSWHSRQEVAFFASSARIGWCTSFASKLLAPPWQCRHSRLLYGSYSLMSFGMVPM